MNGKQDDFQKLLKTSGISLNDTIGYRDKVVEVEYTTRRADQILRQRAWSLESVGQQNTLRSVRLTSKMT